MLGLKKRARRSVLASVQVIGVQVHRSASATSQATAEIVQWLMEHLLRRQGKTRLRASCTNPPGLLVPHMLHLPRRAQFMLPQLGQAQSSGAKSPGGPCGAATTRGLPLAVVGSGAGAALPPMSAGRHRQRPFNAKAAWRRLQRSKLETQRAESQWIDGRYTGRSLGCNIRSCCDYARFTDISSRLTRRRAAHASAISASHASTHAAPAHAASHAAPAAAPPAATLGRLALVARLAEGEVDVAAVGARPVAGPAAAAATAKATSAAHACARYRTVRDAHVSKV